MPQKIQVHINSMAFKGYGVGRINGKVIFIPYSVTGDKAWVEIIEEKKDYSIGRIIQLIEPSPYRVKPPCPAFGHCGGCQWQHINDSVQGELKREILSEVLKRLGGSKEIPPIEVKPSPAPYHYRTRVQLKVREGMLGYYRERSHRLVDIDFCPIAHPLVNQSIPLLRKALSSFSDLQEIEINVSPEEGKGVLVLHPLNIHQELETSVKEFLNTYPVFKGLSIRRKRGTILLGEPHLNFTIPGTKNLKLRTSPGSFFQIHPEQNQTLIQRVLQFSELNGNEKALDLYAGIGNLTLPLAAETKEILGVEESRMSVEDAQFNAEINGIKNCNFIQGRVEDVLKRLKIERPDLIILDPPRIGCKSVANQIIGLKPQKIVYVSCEPTTLSRDLRYFFENGYLLHKLSLIDMFPQTYHMEVVSLLQKG